MANSNMFLWWGSGSPPCWKAMLVLAEKGLWEGCPNKLVEFSKKEHKADEIMKLNPRGQVPTFYDGDTVVNESGAICMYLDAKFTDNPLIPTDPSARAMCFQKMYETENIGTNITKPLVYYKMRTKKEDWDQDLLKENFVKAKDELKLWESSLAGKQYLAGDVFSMADVYFFPLVAYLIRLGGTLADYPNMKQYYERVVERPSVKATWPPHWAAGPGPNVLEGL